MMTAMMAFAMASCDNWDSPYYDTPPLNDEIVGSWESVFGRDGYGVYDIWGYDAVRYDFYSNQRGRYYYYSAFGLEYVGFDWETRGDRLYISYDDGDWENLYYGFDRYGYLILSTDYHFYQYTAYRPAGYYYGPAKEMAGADSGQSDKVAKSERDTVKVKSVSKAIKARDDSAE